MAEYSEEGDLEKLEPLCIKLTTDKHTDGVSLFSLPGGARARSPAVAELLRAAEERLRLDEDG